MRRAVKVRPVSEVNTPVRIMADDREAGSGVIEELRARADVELRIGRMLVGDFDVEDRIRVERKTLRDFGVSIFDGRLFKQCAALSQSAARGVLILEGTAADLTKSGVTR